MHYQVLISFFILLFWIQTRLQPSTKLKKIIQDAKENVVESDVRSRMQPLKDLLEKMIDQLYNLLDPQVFIIVSRGIWDRMAQVSFLVECSAKCLIIIFSLRIFYFLLLFFPYYCLMFCDRMCLDFWQRGRKIGHGTKLHGLQYL